MSELEDRIAELSPEKRTLLMKRLQQKRAEEAKQQTITKRADTNSYPLSYAQQRMWFLNQWEPSSPFYNITFAVRLKGEIDHVALTRSLDEIVRRHEVLRAYFGMEKGLPIQIISPEIHLVIPVIDLEVLPEVDREAELMRLATAEAQKPFDLLVGPLIRASLVKMTEADQVIFLTMHHIVSDGWSSGIFIREIAILYEAFRAGKPSPLPELPIQYADFAQWQREWLQGEVLESQLGYWKRRLSGAQMVLDIPTDRPRPTVQSYNGTRYSFSFPPSVSEKIIELTRQEDATLFMTLLAAFQVLLYRYAGQEDIIIGSPIANRNRMEIEGLIGFFVNTLALRTDLSGEPTFRELLWRVRRALMEDYAHQDIPLEMLIDELHVDRDISRTPLFQVMFTLLENTAKRVDLPSIKMSFLETDSGTAKIDLTLFMEETPTGLRGALEYNTDLFDGSTIERMAEHFGILLEGIASQPDLTISKLPLISREEFQQITQGWNSTITDYPGNQNLASLFEAQVEQSPDAVAIVCEGQFVTYQELNERANQVAHYLLGLGVGLDVLVGIYMERSIEMIIATLGIIKAGGAYLPLDLGYPPDRLVLMLKDSRAPILITLSKHLNSLSGLKDQPELQEDFSINCLDTDPGVNNGPKDNPDCQATSDNLAYVIYTSGSTGVPKGVPIPQRAVSRLVFNTNYIHLMSEDRVAHVSNPSFDAATFEIWGALLLGGRSVIIPRDIALSSTLFAKTLLEQGITAMFLTTALFNHMAAEAPDAFAPVRTVMFGGEAGDPEAVRSVLRNGPPQRLLNAYGPTESTTFATWFQVQNISENARSIPIGRPLSNTQTYILDRNLQPVPVGVPGELFIGGEGLARGYLNRPELTAEKFIPNHFNLFPGAKLYRTGDLARYLADGRIEFLGRIDTQVKLRGFRVELGEIEVYLSRHPGVSKAVVMAREDTPGEKRLVAYVVPKPQVDLNVDELRSYLKQKLPDYMVPSAFVILENLPINPNGKIDRRALQAPEKGRSESDKVYVPPSTPVEKFLVEKWQEVLGIEKIGIYDNFFELGGDSLQAAVLMNRFQEALGGTAHVRALFMAPTVADLAIYMNEYYPETVHKLGANVSEPVAPTEIEREVLNITKKGKIGATEIAKINQIIRPLAPRPPEADTDGQKNPSAIFVLSPPRSGSTLLRTMLAGNPHLFSPPELDLLSFNTLTERKEAFSGKYGFWLEGVIRAVMEIKGCTVEDAQLIMGGFEDRRVTTKYFYRQLQEWIGDRQLVDKTPVYALDMEILKRAEEDFESPLYIHLIRHPYASVYSFIEAKLDGVFFRYDHPFAQRELAELVWIISHRNILEFLKGIPRERHLNIYFEELVRQPEKVILEISNFLGVEFSQEMLKPYEAGRMTDGVRPGAQMVGDFKFYLRRNIDSNAADRWKKFQTDDFLSDYAWELAEQLGYHRTDEEVGRDRVKELTEIKPVVREDELPLSYAQQRLWFLDQWEPGSSYYNIPAAVRMVGKMNIAAVVRSLNEIVRRHETLRSNFVSKDGRATLQIIPDRTIPLPVDDLETVPEKQRKAEIDRWLAQEAQKPFDLTSDPLIRARLLRLSKEEHVIILNMHHIVSDGWSAGILIRELAALYPAFANGKPSPLPDLPIQYVDYAAWQRQWLQGEILEKQLTYWRKQLKGCPPLLELPTDRPRPAILTQNGSNRIFDLPTDLVQKIKALSRNEGVTLFMTLLAAFYVLLYRYSRQEDINIGIPIANRQRAEVEKLIGFFVNTLVLRGDLSGEPGFTELLQRVHKMAVDAYDHQDIPFEMLVNDLQPERNMSHTPLFQVMFTLQDAPIQELRLPNVSFLPLQPGSSTAKFDLLLTMVDKGNELKGQLEFNTDLFDGSTIDRIIAHYTTLLGSITSNPSQPITTLPILTNAELQQIIIDWNATNAEIPQLTTLNELFEKQVERTPQALAVVSENKSLTFRELNQRSNQVANYLRRLGLKPDRLVGLSTERSVEMIVGLIGIWKAGGAYLPLDPAYPHDRLAFMMEDAQVDFLLTQEHLIGNLPSVARQQICLDSDWNIIAHEGIENPVRIARPDSLAYVIYTSGSTGKPKGVMIEHHSAINLWVGLTQAIYSNHPGENLRVSLNAPLAFDASVQEIIMMLGGHCLYLVPRDARQDGAALLSFIRKNRLDVFDCVPSQLKLLMNAGLLDGGYAPRAILPGGEAIDEPTWEALAKAEQCEFYNMYGPTECTVDSTICRLRTYPQKPSIGKPIVNARLYVLDQKMQIVPIGVPGELYIGGGGIGRGYLNRPELTAERFLLNPFKIYDALPPTSKGDRLYKTGDLVRYLPDGSVEFLGRIDQQVKLRGFRIELGEIEATLLEHPAVKQAAVVVREDTPSEKQLVAYLVANLALDLKSFEDLWQTFGKNDRRLEFRLSVNIPARLETNNGSVYLVNTANLSYSGAFLMDAPVELRKDDQVWLSIFQDEGEDPLMRLGKVVFSENGFAGVKLETTVEDRNRLRRFFEEVSKAQDFTVYDRRQGEFRVPLNLPVKIWSEGERDSEAISWDISASGICLATGEQVLDENRKYRLELSLEKIDRNIILDGSVIWQNNGYTGIQFGPDQPERNVIREFLREYFAGKRLTVSDLRQHLKNKLADYMVPSIFVMLDALPLTPNGKIDRKALPKPEGLRPELEARYATPRTSKEEILVKVWEQVLGLDRVGIYDNFFELGGDSILSIQVVAKGNQAGLKLTPRAIFEAQTVAELAVIAREDSTTEIDQGLVTGEVLLTPIQKHFFELNLPHPEHWNQAMLLTVKSNLGKDILIQTVREIMAHHDGLRLRFTRNEAGWEAFNDDLEEQIPFNWVDLSGVEEKEQKRRIEKSTQDLQQSLDIEKGPLMRVAYFDLGPDFDGRLFIVVHHLAIDGISWRILLEDFQTAYSQLLTGGVVRLPMKTTSFQEWSRGLSEYANSPAIQDELDYWLAFSHTRAITLPIDYPEDGNLECWARGVRRSLDPELTHALLQEVHTAYGTEINDVLLSALARTFEHWTGWPILQLDLEGHGREDILEGLDVSRTVGWFTSLFPVLIDLSDSRNPGDDLVAVKEQLHRIPRKGIGYGLLRYLSLDPTIQQALSARSQSQVSFNYLGQVDITTVTETGFEIAPESSGDTHDQQGERGYLLDVVGSIMDGQLRIEWIYNMQLHRTETIERLADAYMRELSAIITYCVNLEASEYTPSDFPDVELSQDDIDDLMDEIEGE